MRLNPILGLLISASLAACGGGDPDVADKYVGTWTSCSSSADNASYKYILMHNKTGATSTSTTFSVSSYYTSTNCTGSFSTELVGRATDTYQGTKTIGADVVDLIERTFDGTSSPPYKDIGLVSGNRLYLGDSNILDTSGYPTALDRTFVFTKQ